MSNLPIKTWVERGGRLLRIRFTQPKTNIVDIAMIETIMATLEGYKTQRKRVLSQTLR